MWKIKERKREKIRFIIYGSQRFGGLIIVHFTVTGPHSIPIGILSYLVRSRDVFMNFKISRIAVLQYILNNSETKRNRTFQDMIINNHIFFQYRNLTEPFLTLKLGGKCPSIPQLCPPVTVFLTP